ncbi:hypothetical protein CCP2SC5_90028 [Azospirillaceae bacterium]
MISGQGGETKRNVISNLRCLASVAQCMGAQLWPVAHRLDACAEALESAIRLRDSVALSEALRVADVLLKEIQPRLRQELALCAVS